MSKTRIKKPVISIPNRTEAEATMNLLARRVNEQRSILAVRDAAVLAINKSHEVKLSRLAVDIDAHTLALQAWAETNPDEFPKDRKSLDLVSGVLGFRTGTPKLALVSRAWNWDKVIAAIKGKDWKYIRTKCEVDKETVLSDYTNAENKAVADSLLKDVGIKVTQDESFFVEPKLADTNARQTAEVAA